MGKIGLKIGTKIKMAREKKGWTQLKLSEKLNKTKSYISNLETGRGGYSINTLLPIAEILDVDISYFYKWDFESTENKEPFKVNDNISNYYKPQNDLGKIIELLSEHPDAQQKVLSYLESYYEGGKSSLTRIGGIIDSLDPDEIERIVPALLKRLREAG